MQCIASHDNFFASFHSHPVGSNRLSSRSSGGGEQARSQGEVGLGGESLFLHFSFTNVTLSSLEATT